MEDNHKAALTEIAETADLLERARLAGTFMETCTAAMTEAGEIRRDAIQGLLDAGYRRSQLATELGLGGPRITQILRDSAYGAERRFFDPGPVIVALGGKRAEEKPEPVVSTDIFAAYETLQALAAQYRHTATYEVIEPPGHLLHLNRPGLIVLGSPRLLPFTGQIVDADPHHGFKVDDGGWYLVDRSSGDEYRAPLRGDQHTDYAYVGRLPRPDGRGTWLYLAGIHGPGTRGAAQWLTEHLSEVYRAVKNGRFSLLVAVHTGRGKKITHTEAITDIRTITGGTP